MISIKEAKERGYITTSDGIILRVIADVISVFFSDENNISILTGSYKINNDLKLSLPNINSNETKEKCIKNGYGNFMNDDNTIWEQFDSNKTIEKRQKEANLEQDIKHIVFAKFFEKEKGIGYHFVGVFKFDKFADKNCWTKIYKKVSDKYELHSN